MAVEGGNATIFKKFKRTNENLVNTSMLICWCIPRSSSDIGSYEQTALPSMTVLSFLHSVAAAFVILPTSGGFAVLYKTVRRVFRFQQCSYLRGQRIQTVFQYVECTNVSYCYLLFHSNLSSAFSNDVLVDSI